MELIGSQIARIKRIVFQAVDLIKSEVNTNYFGCILFLIELKRLNILNRYNSNEFDFSVSLKLRSLFQNDTLRSNKAINAIWYELQYEFDNISGQTYRQMVDLLDVIDFYELNENYSIIFEELLRGFVNRKYTESDLFIQPLEITKFITSLSGNANEKIYNPFSGAASYIIETDSKSSYFAEELNSRIWVIGALRLLAHNLDISEYIKQDSFFNLSNESHQFDLIVSTPPFGAPILNEDKWIREFYQPCKFEDYFLYHGINCLNTTGKLLGLFSPSILFKDGVTKDIRKKMIHKGYLSMVISLPPNLFNFSSIAPVVIVIDKTNTTKNGVKFINGASFFTKQGRINMLDYSGVLSCIENFDINYVKQVSIEQIIENDYNLSVKRYFQANESSIDVPNGYTLTKLGDLVEMQRNIRFNDEIGKIVKVGDLAENAELFEKKSSDFEEGIVTPLYKKIQSNVLLLSKIRTLKPTFCKVSNSEPIFCNNNIVALVVDERKVDIGYLILELYSKKVIDYVNTKFSGVTIPSISIKDILEIPILLPKIEEQKAKYAGFLDAIAQRKKEELISLFISKLGGLNKNIDSVSTCTDLSSNLFDSLLQQAFKGELVK